MSSERATISLPAWLMRELKDEAARRKLSLSALIAEKTAPEVSHDSAIAPVASETAVRQRPDWYGTGHDDPDLSLRMEEIMATPEFWAGKFDG